MPLLLQKFLYAAAIWFCVGLLGAWKYRQQLRGAFNIFRAMALFAVITGVIGMLLPQFCWPWGHIIAPTLIFLVGLTLIYVHNDPDEPGNNQNRK